MNNVVNKSHVDKPYREPSTPHKVVVKVWHNAKFYHVEYNEHTSKILRYLYHTTPNEYFNPTNAEWLILENFKIQ